MEEAKETTQVAIKDASLTRSVDKSRGHRVMCMCVQLNRCCVSVSHRGQNGEVCVFVLAFCKYDLTLI